MPQVFVSIGTNQDRERNLSAAVSQLAASFEDLQLSETYETKAVGFDGDDFFNLVAVFSTHLPLAALVQRLREIEALCGRSRSQKRFGSRSMDIDVLTYGQLVHDADRPQVPRREMLSEAYVLRPLAELAPDACHPGTGEPYAALRARLALDESGMRRTRFDPRAQPRPMP